MPRRYYSRRGGEALPVAAFRSKPSPEPAPEHHFPRAPQSCRRGFHKCGAKWKARCAPRKRGAAPPARGPRSRHPGWRLFRRAGVWRGSPHSVAPGNAVVPNGVTVVAVAHTHPNSNQFSDSDKKYALTQAVDIYVVGPDLNLQKFDFSSQNTMIVGTICPVALSNEQKQQLKAAFQASWDAHIINGVCNKNFSCGTMTWPTE